MTDGAGAWDSPSGRVIGHRKRCRRVVKFPNEGDGGHSLAGQHPDTVKLA